jgi:hypothetical protein
MCVGRCKCIRRRRPSPWTGARLDGCGDYARASIGSFVGTPLAVYCAVGTGMVAGFWPVLAVGCAGALSAKFVYDQTKGWVGTKSQRLEDSDAGDAAAAASAAATLASASAADGDEDDEGDDDEDDDSQ